MPEDNPTLGARENVMGEERNDPAHPNHPKHSHVLLRKPLRGPGGMVTIGVPHDTPKKDTFLDAEERKRPPG